MLSINSSIQVAEGAGDKYGRFASRATQADKAVKYIDKWLDLGVRALGGISYGDRTKTEIPDDLVLRLIQIRLM